MQRNRYAIAVALLGLMVSQPAGQIPEERYACDGEFTPKFEGPAANDHIGFALSTGDWDGDGLDDIAVADGANSVGTGEVWIRTAAGNGFDWEFIIDPFDDSDRSGPSVCFLGDIDGGGAIDLAIGDPHWTNYAGVARAGRVLIYLGENKPPSGSTITIPWDACQSNFPPDISIESHHAYPARFGATLERVEWASNHSDPFETNPSVRYGDLIVGAPGDPEYKVVDTGGVNPCTGVTPLPDPNIEPTYLFGEAFAYLGRPWIEGVPFSKPGGSVIVCDPMTSVGTYRLEAVGNAFTVMSGSDSRSQFGRSIAAIGDSWPAGGDGYSEIVVGAPYARFITRGNAVESFEQWGPPEPGGGCALEPGAASVWSGVSSAAICNLTIPGVAGFEPAALGWAVSSTGDVNGDLIADFVVTAPNFMETDPLVEDPQGAAYVYSGLPSLAGELPDYTVISGTPVYPDVLIGADSTTGGDAFGFDAAGLSGFGTDTNADRDEFALSAIRGNNPLDCGCGLPSGRVSDLAGLVYSVAYDPIALTWSASWVIRGEAKRDGFGMSLAIAELDDVATGEYDLVITAPRTSVNCAATSGGEQGETYRFLGVELQGP